VPQPVTRIVDALNLLANSFAYRPISIKIQLSHSQGPILVN